MKLPTSQRSTEEDKALVSFYFVGSREGEVEKRGVPLPDRIMELGAVQKSLAVGKE